MSWQVHFPKEALELGVCVEEKSLLLEEQVSCPNFKTMRL